MDGVYTVFETFHEYADYITINISSPNTEGLRDFHEQKELEKLRPEEAALREQWMQDEKAGLRKLPPRAWPTYIKLE